MVTAALDTQTLTFTRDITAPINLVYESFTNRDNTSDWLATDGDIHAVPNGFILLLWGREHAYGTFIDVQPNQRLAFTWHDPDVEGLTDVEVTFEETDGVVRVDLAHNGFIREQDIETYQNWWNAALDNLKSILETGANSSITNLVIMGIYPSELTAEVAARLGVPVTEGTLIEGLVEGFSAEAAGLQVNDVIVAVDGEALNADRSIRAATRNKKPGDQVEVTYYRGAEKHTLTVTLRGYPVPPIPANFKALADEKEALYASFDKQLADVLVGATEGKAEAKPADGSYSVKETLAHLILGQRHTLEWLSTYLEGPRRINPYTNVPGRIAAIVAAHPTLDELVGELRRAWVETVAIIRQFTAEHEARKNNLWWITFEMDFQRTGVPQEIASITAKLNQ